MAKFKVTVKKRDDRPRGTALASDGCDQPTVSGLASDGCDSDASTGRSRPGDLIDRRDSAAKHALSPLSE